MQKHIVFLLVLSLFVNTLAMKNGEQCTIINPAAEQSKELPKYPLDFAFDLRCAEEGQLDNIIWERAPEVPNLKLESGPHDSELSAYEFKILLKKELNLLDRVLWTNVRQSISSLTKQAESSTSVAVALHYFYEIIGGGFHEPIPLPYTKFLSDVGLASDNGNIPNSVVRAIKMKIRFTEGTLKATEFLS